MIVTDVPTARRRRAGRSTVLLALIAVFGAIPACSAGADPPLVFRYDLTTVGGDPLPFALESALADRINLTAALLVLEPDGTYSLTFLSEVTNAGEVDQASSGEIGSWSQTSSQVTLVSTFGGATTVASVDGATLTIPSYGITLFFGDELSEDFVISGLMLQERQGLTF